MNVETLKMDPRIARIHYLEYREKVAEHRKHRRLELEAPRTDLTEEERSAKRSVLELEDEQLMLAYRALSKGSRLLNLRRVLSKTGVDDVAKQRLPLLAIARANWEHCFFMIHQNESACFSRVQLDYWSSRQQSPKTLIKLAAARELYPSETWNRHWRSANGHVAYPVRALVPAVPAHLRPAGDLSAYHILWEAKWEPAAPLDPILLKQVNNTMFAVLAQWDLTPLEQMILEGRT